jgi:phage-related protein
VGLQKKISVVFYRTPADNEPVREWLRSLPITEKKTIGENIKAIELSWPVGLPLVRKLDTDLWEIRSQLTGRIARVFFTVWGNYMVLLHGFIKKAQKTPQDEIDLAKKRCNDVHRGGIE